MSHIPRKPAIHIDGASFEEWFSRLKLLAARHEMSWLLSTKPMDHYELWAGGLSPIEAVEQLVQDIRDAF